jgi:hypothetical protein
VIARPTISVFISRVPSYEYSASASFHAVAAEQLARAGDGLAPPLRALELGERGLLVAA